MSKYPLEPSSQEMRQWIQSATDQIVPFVEQLPRLPVKNATTVEPLLSRLREPLPQQGQSLDALLNFIFKEVLPVGINLPSAGYLAYIPVGGIFHTALAEFITMTINRWPGLYSFCPGFIEIEKTVLEWLCEIMGMPKGSGGILTSGGSLANFSAVVTARSEKLGEEISQGVVYCSDQAHHSVLKAAGLAGIPRGQVRKIQTDANFRMSIAHLKEAIAEDRAKGLIPFLLVGNGGTTNTGAIDDLPALGAVAKESKLWFHVDAAWAGAFRMTKKGVQLFNGIENADSVTIDPHKALFLPFGSGALLVRDLRALKKAHSFTADYLPSNEADEFAQIDPSQFSPELSRTLRGLQVWLPLKMLGIQPFIDCLEEKLALTQFATERLRAIPGMEIVAEPQTAIVAFRYTRGDGDLDALNRRILDRINAPGTILLSGTILHGKFAIRIVPMGHRTHREHVEQTLKLIELAISN